MTNFTSPKTRGVTFLLSIFLLIPRRPPPSGDGSGLPPNHRQSCPNITNIYAIFLVSFFSFFSDFSNTYQSMCISRLRFMFLIFIFLFFFGSLFSFFLFLCGPHAFIVLREKKSSPETTPVVGGRLATVPGFQNYRLKQNSHLSFTVSKNHKKAKLDTARFICAEQLDTILMHTLSLHRRPPPSADGSGLFQDICQ